MLSKRDFNPSKYFKLSQDHLVVVALWFLLNENKEATFENLVAEAFTSFPERFQLEGYPDWPNAHVVGKAWVRCRTDKKWLTGSASEGRPDAGWKGAPIHIRDGSQVRNYPPCGWAGTIWSGVL